MLYHRFHVTQIRSIYFVYYIISILAKIQLIFISSISFQDTTVYRLYQDFVPPDGK